MGLTNLVLLRQLHLALALHLEQELLLGLRDRLLDQHSLQVSG